MAIDRIKDVFNLQISDEKRIIEEEFYSKDNILVSIRLSYIYVGTNGSSCDKKLKKSFQKNIGSYNACEIVSATYFNEMVLDRKIFYAIRREIMYKLSDSEIFFAGTRQD